MGAEGSPTTVATIGPHHGLLTKDSTISGSPNRLLGTVFGVVYLLVGLIGFAYTGFAEFAGTHTGEKILGIFEVNPLHNIVHIAIGALLLGASRAVSTAKAANTAVGGVYLLVGVLGLFILDSAANILSLNGADNVLHFLSAAVLLGIGLTADKRVAARV